MCVPDLGLRHQQFKTGRREYPGSTRVRRRKGRVGIDVKKQESACPELGLFG